MSKRICVYCSSSDTLENKYKEAAASFAKAASLRKYIVVCGGSCRGLMGIIIDIFNENGATVEGIIPDFMKEQEFHHPNLEKIKIVDTMSTRKDLLREDTDAIVALPGGIGTIEEFIETYTLKRLGVYPGAVILFNQDGFYDPMLDLFKHLEKSNMLNSNWNDALIVVDNVNDLIDAIEHSKREHLEPRHYAPA